MEPDRLEGEVKALIAHHLAVYAEQLTPETRLLHDIGADGEDGWEFMEAFGQQFKVDLSELEPDLHFGPEGCNPIFVLWSMLASPAWSQKIPITVSDLVTAARSGRWQTPNRRAV